MSFAMSAKKESQGGALSLSATNSKVQKMAYKKLVADGKTIVAFQERRDCDQFVNPRYIQRYVGLSGIEILSATGEEYRKYKRTRKATPKPKPVNQKLF